MSASGFLSDRKFAHVLYHALKVIICNLKCCTKLSNRVPLRDGISWLGSLGNVGLDECETRLRHKVV